LIEFQDVTFTYPASPSYALRGLNLSIGEGEYVVVAGRSGCGKSTLLRCMNGLVPHFYGGTFAGKVTVDGLDTRYTKVRRLAEVVGLVFQDPESQFVTTSVKSELEFGQENLGRTPAEISTKTRELAERFALDAILDKPPAEISGGEKQKAIIASVAAMGTRVLALDEPTSQLDPRSASQIFELLRNLNEQGMTIVLTEHRLKRVLGDASRALVMEQGRVAFDGKPSEVARRFPELVSIAPPPSRPRSEDRSVVLQIRDLWFRYPSQESWAIRNLSFDVHRSELLGIIGSNGSGKSTLALVLAGLLRPYQGRVLLDGEELASIPRSTISRKVGIVFQDPNIHLFHDDVRSEVEFAIRNMGLDAGKETERILDRFGLKHLESRNPRDLSGGQKQTVAIASVMGYRPQVLLLDEPTRGLDLVEKAEIMQTILQLAQGGPTAIVVLTHDLEIIEAFADRVVAIRGGEMLLEGDPKRVIPGFLEAMR